MLNFIIGLFVGANVALFLYALILCAKQSDEIVVRKGGEYDR